MKKLLEIDCHTCQGNGCHVCGYSGLLTVDSEDHLQEELAQLAGAIEIIEDELKECGLSTSEIRDYITRQVKEIAD